MKELIGSNKIEGDKIETEMSIMNCECCINAAPVSYSIIRHFVANKWFPHHQPLTANRSIIILPWGQFSSAYDIFLMKYACTLCEKQCVRKSETSFNIRLNNHCKIVKRRETILTCRDFL